MAEIGLALVRNSLFHGVYRDQEQSTLENIREDVFRRSDSPFRELLLDVIDRAMAHVAKNEFPDAHNEINFIHNLPLYEHEIARWHGGWFYQGEFPAYLDHCNDPARIAHVIELLADVAHRLRQQPTRDDYRAFLADLGPRLVDEALDAKQVSKSAAGGPDDDYHKGALLGWHNAISGMQVMAGTLEIPLADLGLADFNPLELLD